MHITPNAQPNLAAKRIVVCGVLGFVCVFALILGVLAIVGGISGLRSDAKGALTGIFLPSVFLLAGVFAIFRFLPSMARYLVREAAGRYELRLEGGVLFVISPLCGHQEFKTAEIQDVAIHPNLIGCTALSIILNSGSSWTFGNIYSSATLNEIKDLLDEWMTNEKKPNQSAQTRSLARPV